MVFDVVFAHSFVRVGDVATSVSDDVGNADMNVRREAVQNDAMSRKARLGAGPEADLQECFACDSTPDCGCAC